MNRNGLGLVLGLAVFVGAAGSAEAVTLVDPAAGCDQELNIAGEEYVLTGDLSCPTVTSGVRITASGVVFHLAGHTISGDFCDLSQGPRRRRPRRRRDGCPDRRRHDLGVQRRHHLRWRTVAGEGDDRHRRVCVRRRGLRGVPPGGHERGGQQRTGRRGAWRGKVQH